MKKGKKTRGSSPETPQDLPPQKKKPEWVKSDFEIAVANTDKIRYIRAIFRDGREEIFEVESDSPFECICRHFGVASSDTVNLYRIGWNDARFPVGLRDELKFNHFFNRFEVKDARRIDGSPAVQRLGKDSSGLPDGGI